MMPIQVLVYDCTMVPTLQIDLLVRGRRPFLTTQGTGIYSGAVHVTGAGSICE